jgi:hypothetical protein
MGGYMGRITGGGSLRGERILRSAEDQRILLYIIHTHTHIYTHITEHSKTYHKPLWKEEGGGDGNIMEGLNLCKIHCMHVWNYQSEIPHIINVG